MEKTNLIINSTVDIGDNIEIETNGKGRPFSSRFIEAGVAHYEQFGDVLITKETLDKFIHSMVGCPVIIKHKDITDENADKERVGVVSRVWFNEFDGWYWCEGIIWDKQAIDLVKNQGWNVSCTYDFESDKQPKTHNGKKVDMEFTDGEFLHLALVPNPRYERANIVINSKSDTVENDRWITVKPNGEDEKGRHLLIKDGEDISDAMRRQWGVEVKGQQHLFDRKKYKSDTNYKEEIHKKLQEHLKDVQKRYDNLEYLGVADPDKLKDDDYEVISFEEWEDKQEDKTLKEIEEDAQKKREEKKEQKALSTKTNLEEAKTKYEDILSKYNQADRTRWKSGLTNEEYHKAWVDAEKYKKELTTARREYAESIMSNFEAQEHTAYDDRIADKKMRYEEMARKTEAESNRLAKQSSQMLDAIPMGQPILAGHYSERSDRNYRNRAFGKMEKSWELSKKADYYANKSASVGTAGISSDDANAIAKLAQKYQSGVDSAEKRRIIDRVIDIHKRATSTAPASEQTDYGFSIERNKDINRLQLKFDNIPDANTRAVLKSNGFRWSPREKAWQRQLGDNSERSLKYVMEKMKAENALLKGIESILSEHNISEDDLPLLEGLHNLLKD